MPQSRGSQAAKPPGRSADSSQSQPLPLVPVAVAVEPVEDEVRVLVEARHATGGSPGSARCWPRSASATVTRFFAPVGGIAGATAVGYAEPANRPLLLSDGRGKITFADITGLPYWILAVILALVLIDALYGLESWRPWRKEMGREVDGDFGGADGPPGGGFE